MPNYQKIEQKRRVKEILNNFLSKSNVKRGPFKRIVVFVHVGTSKYFNYQDKKIMEYLMKNGYKFIIKPVL